MAGAELHLRQVSRLGLQLLVHCSLARLMCFAQHTAGLAYIFYAIPKLRDHQMNHLAATNV